MAYIEKFIYTKTSLCRGLCYIIIFMNTDHFKDEMCLLQSPIAMMMILIIFTTMIIIIVMSYGAALPSSLPGADN